LVVEAPSRFLEVPLGTVDPAALSLELLAQGRDEALHGFSD
jgi:hypothetical protein